MKLSTGACLGLVVGILLLSQVGYVVTAARCQISNVSYVYPHQADPNQLITVNTVVSGSCASNGMDYYSVRVDLVDKESGSFISRNNTSIGYSATNFTVTAENSVTTPPNNVTWPLEVDVYVIRAGGTDGAWLLDYRNSTNATIQVGAIPVPEFPVSGGYTAIVVLIATILIISRRSRPLGSKVRLRQE